ncbi:hypothetical protein [Niveibacterium sp.]|uniref:hypothetical protein n=1 Tax=Niveibacterium sp. TaxID=2017444 RepID=UPI0035B49BA0
MAPRYAALAALLALCTHIGLAHAASPDEDDDEDEDEDEAEVVEAPASPDLVPPAASAAAPAKSADPVTTEEDDADDKAETAVGLALSYYAMRTEADFLTPVLTLDRGALHLETRYNYEAIHTGSFFVGYTFSGGDAVSFSITPIFGAVYGDNSGVAPGLEASVSWRDFDFYSESEYYIDHHNHHRNYLTAWNEIGWRPIPPLRLALVTQRTRTVDEGRDVQRGALLQWTLKRGATLGINFFNPTSERRYTIASVAVQY